MMRPATQQKGTSSTPSSFEATVKLVSDFFSTRLLLKRYRRDKRDETVPHSVVECEQEFEQIVRCAVSLTDAGVALDAVQWADICTAFSARWNNTCHWVSPRKLRDFLSVNAGSKWTRVESVPPEKEQPAVDLKWYKSLEGSNPITPCMCHLCEVICNSKLQYQAHVQGRTHRTQAKNFLKNGGSASELVSVPVPPEKRGGSKAPAPVPDLPCLDRSVSPRQTSETWESETMSISVTSMPSDKSLASVGNSSRLRVHTPYDVTPSTMSVEQVESPKPSTAATDSDSDDDGEDEVDAVASELLATLSFALSIDGTNAEHVFARCQVAVKEGLSPYGTNLVAEAIANAGIRSNADERLETVSRLCTLVIESRLLEGALETVLTTMVTEGFEVNRVCIDANVEAGFAGALSATKSCGLVKLLGSLVARGVLPDSYLVLLARRTEDAHAHAEVVCTLVQTTKAISKSMTQSAVSAIRTALEDVADAGLFSTRVRRLVCSL